jgi:formylglycine-generating enzyme required for sulfatase activity
MHTNNLHSALKLRLQAINSTWLALVLGAGMAAQAQTGMVPIQGGQFDRGDWCDGDPGRDAPEETGITVNSFLMDSNLVTAALWTTVSNWASANGYQFGSDNVGTLSSLPNFAKLPMPGVSWFDAAKWCNARTAYENANNASGGNGPVYVNWGTNGYRLPTEAEWEYAARGGLAHQRFPLGMDIGSSMSVYGWTNNMTIACYASPIRGTEAPYDLGPPDGPANPVNVGSYPANQFGLYDMAGNLGEWCWDYYSSSYYPSASNNNPHGPATGTTRVFRGGDWMDYPRYCCSAYRRYTAPSLCSGVIGFRCVIGTTASQVSTPTQAQSIDFDPTQFNPPANPASLTYPTNFLLTATSSPLDPSGNNVIYQTTNAAGMAYIDSQNVLWVTNSGTFTVTATEPQVTIGATNYLAASATLTFTVLASEGAPTNGIISPAANQRVTNTVPTFTIAGQAAGDAAVTNVYYSLNGEAWTGATTTSNWTNWTANVTLTSGSNTVSAYAVDSSGNLSATDEVSFVYVPTSLTFPTAPLNLIVEGIGTITGATNGQLLDIGQTVRLTTKPGAGYVLTNWLVQVDGATVLTTNKAAPFVMASNLTLTATFVDVLRPTNLVTAPMANQRVSNAVFVVTGNVKDNGPVANVFYSLNNDGWSNAVTANGFTNWTASVTLTPGTNTIAAYAEDASGNISKTNTVSIIYVLSAELTVNVGVGGTVTPKLNGALLPIGQIYSLTAKTNAGFAFAGWTGSIATNKPTLTFVMASNLVLNANFADIAKPTNEITAPKQGQRWSNAVFTVTGKAGDNAAVANVFYSLNNGGWSNAITANGFTNWTAPVALTPGTNTIAAYAVDTSGNISKTNTLSLVYILSAELTVNVGLGGTVTPNENGALLPVGQIYSLTAKTNAGFAFAGWTGSITTNKSTLTFVMASNLVFNANFTDIAKPTNQITAPTAGQRWSNAVFLVTGKAHDNVAVSNVFYSLNNGGWSNAVTANGFTNWTAQVTLTPGTNSISAYAIDTSGNLSTTNSVKVIYVSSAKVVVSLESRVVSKGSLQMQLSGPEGTTVVLESSTDLINWSPVQTNTVSSGGLSVSQPMNQSPVQFFRVRPQ